MDAVTRPEPKRVTLAFSPALNKMGKLQWKDWILGGKHIVTVRVEISQLRCQHSREEFTAELSSIGRNHRLIELTFESLSEKSRTSHSSENIRSMKYKIESKSELNFQSWL